MRKVKLTDAILISKISSKCISMEIFANPTFRTFHMVGLLGRIIQENSHTTVSTRTQYTCIFWIVQRNISNSRNSDFLIRCNTFGIKQIKVQIQCYLILKLAFNSTMTIWTTSFLQLPPPSPRTSHFQQALFCSELFVTLIVVRPHYTKVMNVQHKRWPTFGSIPWGRKI